MRTRRVRAFATACCFVVAASACGPATAEEQLITKFFQAARTLDSSILSGLATVGFNPRTEGSVQSFRVSSVGPEQRRPLTNEHELALTSLVVAGQPEPDLTGLVVEMIAKDVTIDAEVRTPEGAMSSRTITVTVQRSVATGAKAARQGRWIVTGLRQAPASRTSRATSSVPRS